MISPLMDELIGLIHFSLEVDLASGWDEYPEDCKELMPIREMGFYRLEFTQSRINWALFANARPQRDKYGRRIIDPDKENH